MPRATSGSRCSDPECHEALKAGNPLLCPRPGGRQVELAPPAAVGDPAGQREEAAADRLGDEWTGDLEPEGSDPTDEVVGDGREHRPGAVRTEAPRRTVRETRALLEVPDRELDDGVTAVIRVEADCVADPVGDE